VIKGQKEMVDLLKEHGGQTLAKLQHGAATRLQVKISIGDLCISQEEF